MMKKFKVGIIGVGTIGCTHIRAFTANKKAEVAAIADINPDTLKTVSEKFKIEKAFTDYHDLLAIDDLDGVAVCTPPFLHAKITCDAASSGKHVLCEKPMAMNSEEARRMVETCDEAGVKLGICSARFRFTHSVKLAKKYIDKEGITATFETSWASNIGPHTETLIFGSAGGLKLNPFTYYTEERGLGVSKIFDIPQRLQEIWSQLIDDFIMACRKDRDPKTSGKDGLKTMEIIEMAYRSAELKREVSIQELQ